MSTSTAFSHAALQSSANGPTALRGAQMHAKEVRRTTRLRQMLESPRLEYLMEAHNGLSARIVEEAGFAGIWASGLSISASLGVRDNNEASWTEVLDVVEFMADATSLPILLDGDTGYGNFNNVRRLIGKLEQRGVAGVCLEDKLFPKSNSFIKGTAQPLADIEEFSGKIKAARDSCGDSDFVVIARVEAFIAGWGLAEALRRAEAYRLAGADAILIHSALSDPSEILSFTREWAQRLPVVIVPTKYYKTPTQTFRDEQVSLCIWANHSLRSATRAMQETVRTIFRDESLMNVENTIVPVQEIFRLQNDAELAHAEERYLPAARQKPAGLVLCDDPEAVAFEEVVARHKRAGVGQITVVLPAAAGPLPGNIESLGVQEWSQTRALRTALAERHGPVLVTLGSTFVQPLTLRAMHDRDSDLTVLVDVCCAGMGDGPVAICVAPTTASATAALLLDIQDSLPDLRPDPGQINKSTLPTTWTQVLLATRNGVQILQDYMASQAHLDCTLAALLGGMARAGIRIGVVYTVGSWGIVDPVAVAEVAGEDCLVAK